MDLRLQGQREEEEDRRVEINKMGKYVFSLVWCSVIYDPGKHLATLSLLDGKTPPSYKLLTFFFLFFCDAVF